MAFRSDRQGMSVLSQCFRKGRKDGEKTTWQDGGRKGDKGEIDERCLRVFKRIENPLFWAKIG